MPTTEISSGKIWMETNDEGTVVAFRVSTTGELKDAVSVAVDKCEISWRRRITYPYYPDKTPYISGFSLDVRFPPMSL